MQSYKQYVEQCDKMTTEEWSKREWTNELIEHLQADAPFKPNQLVYCLSDQQPYVVVEYQPQNGRGGCFWLKDEKDKSYTMCGNDIVDALPNIKVYRMYKNRVVEPPMRLEDHGDHYMIHCQLDDIDKARSNLLICFKTMVREQMTVPRRCAHPGCRCTSLQLRVQLNK